jgi:putative endonuclease
VKDYYVYKMTNRSRVVLYVGMTSRLEGRTWEHKNHVVDGFTSKYNVDRLVYYEQFCDPFRRLPARRNQSLATREKERVGGNIEPEMGRPH